MSLQSKPTKNANLFYGWICILTGLYPIALAFGFIEIDKTTANAPVWIIALSGIIFLIGGIWFC